MRLWQLLLVCVLGSSVPVIQGAPAVPLEDVDDELETLLVDDRNILTCSLCNLVVNEVFTLLENGTFSDQEIIDVIIAACEGLGVLANPAEVCGGTAAIAWPTIKFIYQNGSIIPGNICGMLIQNQDCRLSDPEVLEWNVLSSSVPKPPIVQQNYPPLGSPSNIKVLHLADIHWDPEYLEGSNAHCGDPLCCRATSGEVMNATDAAGFWGDYRTCDLPWRTVDNGIRHMAQQHSDVSYIIWTGDLVPHDVWSTSKEENIMIIDRLMTTIQQYFPGVPVYPTLGNHESNPVNSFSPPEITDVELSTGWVYEEADKQWAKWLPVEVSSTIRYGGYYTALVQPGLRIVSMNMNYCYTLNYWTYYKSQDPAEQLQWLKQVLEEAERAGEKVHILSHIPPGNDDCWTIFSREFGKIINRFESTVAAQFYGHTHDDEFKIFYDETEPERPVNVAFIAPSLTTYSKLNPGYRTYMIDGQRPNSTWAVLDFGTWIMNLTEANIQGSAGNPTWSELYHSQTEYNIPDASPQSMNSFFQRMLTDDALFYLYFKNYYKNADGIVGEGCDNRCRSDHLCEIVTTDIADRRRCEPIRHLFLGHAEF